MTLLLWGLALCVVGAVLLTLAARFCAEPAPDVTLGPVEQARIWRAMQPDLDAIDAERFTTTSGEPLHYTTVDADGTVRESTDEEVRWLKAQGF